MNKVLSDHRPTVLDRLKWFFKSFKGYCTGSEAYKKSCTKTYHTLGEEDVPEEITKDDILDMHQASATRDILWKNMKLSGS
jgi:hypothetical protein